MRRALLATLILTTSADALAAQGETVDQYNTSVGDVTVNCFVGNASGRGTCSVSHRPQILFGLRTSFVGDSIVMEFFSIDGIWLSNDVTVRVDSFAPHTSARSVPFGKSETRAILEEIDRGRKMNIDAPVNEKGKLGHTTLDLAEMRDGIRLAHGFIQKLAHRNVIRADGSRATTGLACIDGVAPPGTDTTAHAFSRAITHTLMLPPLDPPGKVKGHTVRLNFLVGPTGGVDSVAVTGITDAAYIEKLIRGARTYRFFPAMVENCTTTSWYSLEITIGN